MNRDKVAVITRTKDRPLFLKRALRSVSEQTFSDYRHVVVNDGGDEGAVADIVKEFTHQIHLYHRKTSSNAPDTLFNESIDRVESEYIAIHDDDDTWHPEFLERAVAYLDSHRDIGGVVVRADKVTEKLKDAEIKEIKRTQWMPDLKVINLYRQCIDNQLTPITFLFRRDAYIAVGKFDDSLPVVGDWEFGVRFLQAYDVDFLDPGFSLANYHHRAFRAKTEGNTSFSNNDKHRYYTNKVMNKYLRNEMKSGRLGPGYVMSHLKYNQNFISTSAKKVAPTFVVNYLKRRAGN